MVFNKRGSHNYVIPRATTDYARVKDEPAISPLWGLRINSIEERVDKHDIYWGCHSCNLEPNHKGKCKCKCGALPTKNTIFWGNDFVGFTEEEKYKRYRGLNIEDMSFETEVLGDLRNTIVDGVYQRSMRPRIIRIKRRARKPPAKKKK